MSGNVVELAESIGGGVVELADTANDSGGSSPGARFAFWVDSTPSITEGEQFKLTLRLSEADDRARACVISPTANTTAVEQQFSFTPTEVLWPAGTTEAQVILTTQDDAAAGSSSLIELALDAQAELVENPSAAPVQVDVKYGPDKVQVTVEDEAITGTPEFYIAGAPAVSYDEGSGSRNLFVVLDEPAVDAVSINVVSTDGSASSSGPNALFVAINDTVTIPAGAQRSTPSVLTILDNDQSDGNTDFTINATLVSGTATPRAGQTTLTVTIQDNDSGLDLPRVEFQTSSQVVPEGTAIDVIARSVDIFGNARVFAGEQFVPVSSVTTGKKDVDYVEDWGKQAPGTLRFAPGTSQASFRVTVVDDGFAFDDASETVVYTIDPAPAGAGWQVGTASTVTLTFGQDDAGATQLLLPASSGSETTRRVIQGVCAIVPPSETLPTYAIDKGSNPGEKVQLVGLKRNAANQWISARFYAMHDGTESIPRTVGSLKLREATANDVDPPEAGSFVDYPAFSSRIFTTNPITTDLIRTAGYTGATPAYSNDLYPDRIEEDWMSPTGKFKSTGPSLCEEVVYFFRPLRDDSDLDPADAEGSEDYCAILQVGLKRFAGDSELIMVSGRLLNGAWNKDASPFLENPDCDGELYFQGLYMQLSSVVGNNWSWNLPVAHPGQTAADDVATLLPSRDQDYFMRNCAQYQFHLALVAQDASPSVLARALDYWKCKHAAWAVGPLGSTHQRIYGEACEETIDYGRPEVGFADGSQSGWLGIKAIGDYQGDGDGGATYDGMVNIWQSGAQAPYTRASGAYDGTRQGWWQPSGPAGAGTDTNEDINGQLATVPYWGFWLRQRCAMGGTFARTRVSYRDVNTGAAPFWWTLARVVASSPRVPILGGLEDRVGSHRHWHFNTQENTTDYDLWGDLTTTNYRLAPTTRVWNTFLDAEDPARALMDLYPSEHPTHWGRVRNELSDCWEVLGEWMAFACWEELAAFYSRVQSPVNADYDSFAGSPNRQDQTYYNTKELNFGFFLNQWAKNLGYCVSDNTGTPQDRVGTTIPTSSVAWMLDILGGFIQVAPDELRAEFAGTGPVTSSLGGQKDQTAEISRWLGDLSMPNGFLFRSTSPTNTPNPYLGTDDDPGNSEAFDPTNLTLRTGALPWENSGDATEQDNAAAYQLFYQHLFYIKGLTAWAIATEADLSSLPSWMLEAYRSHDNYRQGAELFTSVGGSTVQSNFPIVAQGPVVSGSLSPANSDDLRTSTFTEQDMRDGAARWQVIKPNANPAGFEDITSHESKSGVSGSLGAIYAGDPNIARLTQAVFRRQADTQQQFLAYCIGQSNVQSGGVSFAFNIANLTGGRRQQLLGEHTWMAGYIAYLQNIIS